MLIFNDIAANQSSNGVKQYFKEISSCINLPYFLLSDMKAVDSFALRFGSILHQNKTADLLWTPVHFGPAFVNVHVVTIHDCINVEHSHQGHPLLKLYMLYVRAMFIRARALVAISESTKESIIRNYHIPESKLIVIKSPTASRFQGMSYSIDDDFCDPLKGIPFFLLVTNKMAHKNNISVFEALASSRELIDRAGVVIVGTLSEYEQIFLRSHNITHKIFSDISDSALAALYSSCQLFISPSISEGHNLTISEALSLDAPVLISDIPVHREFYGACRFFTLFERDELVYKLHESLIDKLSFKCNFKLFDKRSFKDVAMDYKILFESLC